MTACGRPVACDHSMAPWPAFTSWPGAVPCTAVTQWPAAIQSRPTALWPWNHTAARQRRPSGTRAAPRRCVGDGWEGLACSRACSNARAREADSTPMRAARRVCVCLSTCRKTRSHSRSPRVAEETEWRWTRIRVTKAASQTTPSRCTALTLLSKGAPSSSLRNDQCERRAAAK